MRWVAWSIGVFLLLLLIVFPIALKLLVWSGWYSEQILWHLDKLYLIQMYSLRALGAVWIFFVGSCFASFLNVVAWRLPRGRSFNGSSHCPMCNCKLRFLDNLPVFGWLRLDGKCRGCNSPIPPRYLIVEVCLGSIFLLLAIAEVFSGGMSLPFRVPNDLAGFEQTVLRPQWDLIQAWFSHVTLICFLFTFAMIRDERITAPFSILLFGIVVGLVFPIIMPSMTFVPWNTNGEYWILESASLDQWMTLLTGLVVGVGAGVVIQRLLASRWDFDLSSLAPIVGVNYGVALFSLVGLFLGWQSVIFIAFLTGVLWMIVKQIPYPDEVDAPEISPTDFTAKFDEALDTKKELVEPSETAMNSQAEEHHKIESEQESVDPALESSADEEAANAPIANSDEGPVEETQSLSDEAEISGSLDTTNDLTIKTLDSGMSLPKNASTVVSPYNESDCWTSNVALLTLISTIFYLLTWKYILGLFFPHNAVL